MAIYIYFLQDEHNKKHYRNMMSRASKMWKLIIYDSNFYKARSSDYAKKHGMKITEQRWSEETLESSLRAELDGEKMLSLMKYITHYATKKHEET